jgi:hypothetical protein
MLKIERPRLNKFLIPVATGPDSGMERISHIKSKDFKEWFDNCVEPINKILAEGVEVTCYKEHYEERVKWCASEIMLDCKTHKALLINIQPIKEETAEGVLRDILNSDTLIRSELAVRARRVLDGNKEEGSSSD